jgi:type II secretory pathway component PulM
MMSTRHILLTVIASMICLAALVQWCVLPLSAYYGGLEEDISASRQRLQRIMELRREYEQVRSRSGERQDSGAEAADFSLYSFLDRLAEEQGLKGSIVFMRPQSEQLSGGLTREVVRLRLAGVTTRELVPYLYRLGHSDSPVRVEDMTIRSREDTGNRLQVDLRISVLKV